MPNGERIIFIPESESDGLPLRLFSACRRHCQESVIRHTGAPFYQILLVLSGHGRVRLGDREYPLTKGCAFYVSKDMPVEYYDDGELCSAFVTAVGDGMDSVGKYYTESGFLYLNGISCELYCENISRITKAYHEGAEAGKLSALTYSFFVDFFENAKRTTTGIEEVALYMERNLDKKLTLDFLGRVSTMSVSSLCHKFKDRYGKTVIEYLIEKRLSYARTLLLSGEMLGMKEIAVSSGFEDPSYFCRSYKKRYGKTPREDRNSSYQKEFTLTNVREKEVQPF
ncbi:MAG: helix-turn-helix transcriptional regulator [Clostridia bacterium]|nr:helix-turn-helix transcriptional regulator [Clostridia bacterium]